MYLPAGGMTTGADAQFASSATDNICEALAQFFDDVSNSVPSTPVIVYSVAGSAARRVTEVRVDTKPDVQRRRVNKIAATSTSVQPVP
jgi:hypothetical protein